MNIVYANVKSSNVSMTNKGTVAINNTQIPDIAISDPILDVHLAAQNVVKMDIGSESDPMCVLFIPINGKFTEVARTEVIWDNPNPSWVTTFKIVYLFEMNQPLRFCLYDCDSNKGSLENHDFIGYADTNVQTLVSEMGHEIKLELNHDTIKSKRGTLILNTNQIEHGSDNVQFKISVSDLKKVHMFSRNWPYITISKPSESGRLLPVFRSEVMKKTSTCTFKQFDIPFQSLCNGDINTPVTISVYNYEEGKLDKLIGSVEMSVQNIMEHQATKLSLLDSSKKNSGYILFNQVEVIQRLTFLDYLRGGLQLNLITAIDFTASNRDPRDSRSLHFLSQQGPNQYESCIWAVGSVICPYDSDQLFPVFGFGGKINGQLSHCFPLTFDPSNPNVQGLNGIIESYRNSLNIVQLSGPTCFAPIIRNATQVAEQSFTESNTYTILLIVTDGVINDMLETTDAVVEATMSPLSIIIVGVGDADFSLMDQLDADETPLRSSRGQVMKRDIVQFVPFNDFRNSSPAALAAEVLEEVPRQVNEFCVSRNFRPQTN